MSPKQFKVARVVIGTILFGSLMGFRDMVASPWAKVGVAALAGACLGVALLRSKPQAAAPPQT